MAILLALSCNEKTDNHPGRHDSAVVRKDTVPISRNGPIDTFSDTLLPADFRELKKGFSKDSNGRMDSTREISLDLIHHFRKEGLDSSWINSVNPVVLIGNKYGYFFMIKANCIAGGNCAVYYLLAFDKKGEFVKSKKLGKLVAEEDDITVFKYRLTSDTTLVTYEVDDDLEKDKETTSKEVLVKLSFSKSDRGSGAIK